MAKKSENMMNGEEFMKCRASCAARLLSLYRYRNPLGQSGCFHEELQVVETGLKQIKKRLDNARVIV